MFFGGWASPLDTPILNIIPGALWLLAKVVCVLFLFLWFRATFPRFRYDQVMRLGWKVFISADHRVAGADSGVDADAVLNLEMSAHG